MTPSMDLLFRKRLGSPGMGDIIIAISVSSVHIWAVFLVAVGRQLRKLDFWFLEVLNIAFPFQGCIKNIAKSLGNFRKMVMWFAFHVYMIKMLVTWWCN